MTKSSLLRRACRYLLGTLTVVIIVLSGSNVASAHTDFDSSTPSDQDTVEGPVDQITVSFTNPAAPAGDGFELLDPTGTVRAPTSIDPTDGTEFVLGFEPPLAAGTYGVRWKVQAGDAHPIEGTFQFQVTEPASAATASTTPTTSPPVAASPGTPSNRPEVAKSDTTEATAAPTAEALEDFLASSSSADGAAPVGRVGRVLTFIGTIFGVGALAALVWVIRGHRDELRNLVAWIRLAGLVIAAGGLVELAGLQAAQSSGVGDLLETKAGLAAILKLIGGAVIWFGFHERAGRVIAPARSLSAAVSSDLVAPIGGRAGDPADGHRWSPTASAGVGLAGFAIVLASFWFDGHTVSKGPWAIHSLVNLVHLGAAAVWGGGVFAMTTVAWLRRRRSERAGMAAMVIRFSGLATYSLLAVIAAGLTMTVLILDTPGDLFATEWGRILVAKTLAVAVVAGIGAYNHFKLRPALEQSPDDPGLAKELRMSLAIESAVFVVVVILTAWLVASAT